jgi:putative CocE/NonD family hydrolase
MQDLRNARARRGQRLGGVGIAVEYDVEVVTRDGTVLRSDIYRDAESERPQPVLLLRTPYDKTDPQIAVYLHPGWYAKAGFIVVVQDVRGRFASDGRFDPFLNERADGFDSVEWAANLEGSNGRVGMYGASYVGAVQFLAAAERPPRLYAIAPAITSADFHGWMYESGALNLGFVANWSLLLAQDGAHRSGDTVEANRLASLSADAPNWLSLGSPMELAEILGPHASFMRDWLSEPSSGQYWNRLGSDSMLDDVDIPALHITGWFDIFLSGSLKAYERLRSDSASSNQRLVVGPWAHYPWGDLGGGANDFAGAGGTGRIDELQVAFFRQHLLDQEAVPAPPVPAPPVPAPPVPAPPVSYYALFDGWRYSEDWPPTPSRSHQLFLRSHGSANTRWGDGRLESAAPIEKEQCDLYQYYPPMPVSSVGGHSCCDPEKVPMGSVNQLSVEQMPNMLVYTTAPFGSDTVIAGEIVLELHCATDAESADYVARLCLVNEQGSWNVAEGIRRLGAHDLRSARDADGVVSVMIPFHSTSVTVRKGQRLRLDITGGSFPTFDVNPQTGASPLTTPTRAGSGALHAILHEPRYPSSLTYSEVLT